MPKITFLPQNITVETEKKSPLLKAARFAEVSVETPCGGKGVCRKCLVKIISGMVDIKSGSYREINANENYVLICQTNISDEDVTVEILTGLYGEEGKFDDVTDISDIFYDNTNQFMINSAVKQIDLQVSKPAPLDGLSDFDRLKKAFVGRADLGAPGASRPTVFFSLSKSDNPSSGAGSGTDKLICFIVVFILKSSI